MKLNFKTSFLLKIQLCLSGFAVIYFFFYFSSLKTDLEGINKNRSVYKRFFDTSEQKKEGFKSLVKFSFPERLKNIPFGESSHLVLGTKTITIRNRPAAYNPSLIKYGSGYLMFFRYDVKEKDSLFSYIGCTELDSTFIQTDKEFTTIDTQNNHSDDPKAFSVGDHTYLTYNVIDFNGLPPLGYSSAINIAEIDLKKRKLQFTTDLELNFSLLEKNWAPFEYVDNQKGSRLYFQYRLNPHKILELPDPKVNHIIQPIFPKSATFQTIHWENEPFGWGELRGGTPAINIGDQYLAFFHTSFTDKNGIAWYNMGAYTFEASPPFRITAISPHPILFNGIYESNFLNTASTHKLVIFPSGFILENKEGQDLIQLFCGENDSAIKMITLDKAVLLKSLKKI